MASTSALNLASKMFDLFRILPFFHVCRAEAGARRLGLGPGPTLQGLFLGLYGADCFSKLPTPLADRRFAAGIAILPRPSRAPPPSGPASDSKSHFNRSFGNIKAFNLKKLKLSLSPSPPWPQAACGWGAKAGKFLRQTKGGTVFGLESFESIPDLKPLEVQ